MERGGQYGYLTEEAWPAHFKDTGCELHPKCLECPLPACKYDDPRGARAVSQRDRELAMAHQCGIPIAEIMGRYKLSRRSVFRIIHEVAADEERREEAERKATAARLPEFLG